MSFRSLPARRVYPRARGPKQRYALALAAGAVVLALAGCGGGGTKEPEPARQVVAGAGFRFGAPAAWRVSRTPQTVTAVPAAGGETLLTVAGYRLVKRYRPERWPQAAAELDRVAAQLARRLSGGVRASRTVTVAGGRARQYELAYERGGASLRQRITFVLRGLREYELLCRWRDGDAGAERECAAFVSSFTLG